MAIKKRLDRRTHKRAYVALAVFAVLVLWIIIKLFIMQVVDYEDYQMKVIKQMTTEVEVNPDRGIIYDTNGNIIATNITTYSVVISPQDIIDEVRTTEEERPDSWLIKLMDFLMSLKKGGGEEEKVYKSDWVDLNGNEVHNIYMNEFIANSLSEILGVEKDFVLEKADLTGRRYEVIAKNVDEETAEEVLKLIDSNGLDRQIFLITSSKRYYPYNTLAAHVIGFTDADGKGLYGMENYYNNILEGKSGRYITAQDAKHNDMPFEYETYVEAQDGYNLTSTVDMYIQFELENQLEAALNDHQAANRVTGIVMDVDTCGILAMATAPTFDLNAPRELSPEMTEVIYKTFDNNVKNELEQYEAGSEEYESILKKYALSAMWKNKAITETYEPGSTFKIMTTAMALEEGVVTPQDTFYCSGALSVEGYPKPIHCHKRTGHGLVTFRVGLQQSCNPTLMTVGLRLGQEKFYNYFEQFGYNAVTGIDLPNEIATYYHDYQNFTIASLAVYSFGQTFKTTALQQLTAISAVANGGKLITPHVLKDILDDDGNVVQSYETDVKRQVVSEETCKTITEILEEGVSGNGGARNAYTAGYKVAAKTGTSEKKDKKDENGEYSLRVGSCVAYAPADDPKVAVIFIVDEPSAGSVFGSVVAAPYVSNLMSFILPYMGYEPSYTEEELEKVEIGVSNYVGSTVENAEADLGWREINYKIIGDGLTVTSQIPAGGSTMTKKDGILYLYTGDAIPTTDIEVPDLVGKTAEAANRIVTNLGLNVSISGASNGSSATVSSQSPAAGEVVSAGTVVTIEMRHNISSDD